MPGYSGTPLPKKLGIKPGLQARFLHLPEEVRSEIREALADCEIVAASKEKSSVDFMMIFTKSKPELKTEFANAAKWLTPAGMFWVSWPKKSSGVPTDLTENIVRELGLAAGLVDVKVCAVTDIWSGLKFVRRVKDRSK